MQGPFLFLDIDGVLNDHEMHPENKYTGIKAPQMALLNKIIRESDAKIVVVSAWRYFILRGEMTLQGFAGMMYTHGLVWGCIVGHTGQDIPNGSRGGLCHKWLAENYCLTHKCHMVAIDDMDLGYRENGFPFIPTEPKVGLTESLADFAIQVLAGKAYTF